MSTTRWIVVTVLVAVIVGGSYGIYYILSAHSGPGEVMALAQIRPNIVDEDQLKQQLTILHPEVPPDKQSRYQLFVTPDDAEVQALAARVDGAREAYAEAVQWTWVSDLTLHGQTERWLMPGGFLADTPDDPDNPRPGFVVSDCEEQANTLVSVLRAEGIAPDAVRVVLGRVNFGGQEGGHAWVEIMHQGEWLPLEATSGPYWDDDEWQLVPRAGNPFDYFAERDYPVVQVWAYYNDIYYLDPRSGEGNAPASWLQPQLLIQ